MNFKLPFVENSVFNKVRDAFKTIELQQTNSSLV